MSYATTNPPKLMVPTIGGGTQLWSYTSADARTTVEGASYFSNAKQLGMRVGDTVVVVYTTGYVTTIHSVASMSGNAATINAAVLA
jgi:hypothetical protein